MPDLPKAKIVHMTRRRLRIKIPGKRHDRQFFSNMREYLSNQPAVEGVEANSVTASILIHSPDSRAFVEALGRARAFTLVERLSEPERNPLEQVRQQLLEWDAHLQRWTGSRHDARAYIFLVLILGAAYQLVRGEIFAPAATLLWYSGEALRLWVPADTASDGSPSGATESKEAG